MKNIKKLLLVFCLAGIGFETTSAVKPDNVSCVGNAVDKASNCVFSLAAAICIVTYSLNRKPIQKILNKEYCLTAGTGGVDISKSNFVQKTKSYFVKKFNTYFGRQEELSINCNLLDVIVLSSLLSVAIC